MSEENFRSPSFIEAVVYVSTGPRGRPGGPELDNTWSRNSTISFAVILGGAIIA